MNRILAPFSSRRKRFTPWMFGLKIGLLAALVLLWWLQDQDKQQQKDAEREQPILLPPDEKVESVPTEPDQPDAPKEASDDLTAISGIGPTYAAVLHAAGVTSYAQLATLTPEDIRDVFRTAEKRAPNPSTWPEQAANLAP